MSTARRGRTNRIIGWAAAAMLLTACSNDTSKGGGHDGGASTTAGACGTPVSSNACPDGCNPCTRLSDAQVAAVVGKPAVKGTWDSDACLWDFGDPLSTGSFEVGFHINTDYATFEDLCHPGGSVTGITVTPVTGVGDDACYLATPAGSLGAFELNFLKGCWAYSMTIAGPAGQSSPFSDTTLQADEKALALDAVPNL